MSTHPALTGEDWTPTIETWGARLALMRQAMGWNMTQAARECGINDATWRDWETESFRPRNIHQVAAAIHAATGVSTKWLVGRNVPMAQRQARQRQLRARGDSNSEPSDPKVEPSWGSATHPANLPHPAALTPQNPSHPFTSGARNDLGGAA